MRVLANTPSPHVSLAALVFQRPGVDRGYNGPEEAEESAPAIQVVRRFNFLVTHHPLRPETVLTIAQVHALGGTGARSMQAYVCVGLSVVRCPRTSYGFLDHGQGVDREAKIN